jgi:hypothetical protein
MLAERGEDWRAITGDIIDETEYLDQVILVCLTEYQRQARITIWKSVLAGTVRSNLRSLARKGGLFGPLDELKMSGEMGEQT